MDGGQLACCHGSICSALIVCAMDMGCPGLQLLLLLLDYHGYCEGTVIITPAAAAPPDTTLWPLLLLLQLLFSLLVGSHGVLNTPDVSTTVSKDINAPCPWGGKAFPSQAQVNGKVCPWPKHLCRRTIAFKTMVCRNHPVHSSGLCGHTDV